MNDENNMCTCGDGRCQGDCESELFSEEWLTDHTGRETSDECTCGGSIWTNNVGIEYCDLCSWSNDDEMTEFLKELGR